MDIFDIYDVFTPTKPAKLTFVERDIINEMLVNALRTPGKQLVVYGHSGSGKTTLLVNKLNQLYERHVITRCMEGLSYEQILIDAFDQLSPYYEENRVTKKTHLISSNISQDFFLIKSQVSGEFSEESESKYTRSLPPQLTPQSLAKFIGEINACWVLDDFHKIDDEERNKISQTMKVFMDMATDYNTVKIIAIGAVDTARRVIEYDTEMRNRIAEINVPMINETEMKLIINTACNLLNISLDISTINRIIYFSGGHASICHQLCLNMCVLNNIYETCKNNYTINHKNLDAALIEYIENNSNTLKKAFDSAIKTKIKKRYNNAALILRAISELPESGALRSEIYKKITTHYEPNYPHGNLTKFLKVLCTENDNSLLNFDSYSGKYLFKDAIHRAFALAYFDIKENHNIHDTDNTDRLVQEAKDQIDELIEKLKL